MTGDEGYVALDPGRNFTGGRMQNRHLRTLSRQEPGGADQRVSGERQLGLWCEDAKFAGFGMVDEDRLREAEVRRDPLAFVLRYIVAFQEHPEWVASGAFVADEYFEDV